MSPSDDRAEGAQQWQDGVITPRQIRAARGLLAWSQADLAERAGVSRRVVNRVEGDVADTMASTLRRIEAALEEAGVEFIPAPGEGVRMRV